MWTQFPPILASTQTWSDQSTTQRHEYPSASSRRIMSTLYSPQRPRRVSSTFDTATYLPPPAGMDGWVNGRRQKKSHGVAATKGTRHEGSIAQHAGRQSGSREGKCIET